MTDEPIALPIPEPLAVKDPPAIRTLDASEWIRALRSSETQVRIDRILVGLVPPRWTTKPRPADCRYDTHYLFYAGEASLALRLREGWRTGGPGALVWLPPGVPYGVGLETGPHHRTLHRLRFRVLRHGVHLAPRLSAYRLEGLSAAAGTIESLRAETALPDAYTDELARVRLIRLSIDVFRSMEERRPAKPRLSRAQAQHLIDYVHARPDDPPAPADLARELRLSPAYFARLFKRTFGEPPRVWIVRQRVRRGADLLLHTALDVGEVAYRLGYNEPRLFSRQFRQYMGTTPTAYRRDH